MTAHIPHISPLHLRPFGGDVERWLAELIHARRVYDVAARSSNLLPPAGREQLVDLLHPRELTHTGWIRWEAATHTTCPEQARPIEIGVIHPAWRRGLRRLLIRSVWGRRPTEHIYLGSTPPVPVLRFIAGLAVAALGVICGLATPLPGIAGLWCGLLAGAMITYVIPATVRRLTRSRVRTIDGTAPGACWLWHLMAADQALHTAHTHPAVLNGPAILWHAARLAVDDSDQAALTLNAYLGTYLHLYASPRGRHVRPPACP
jgi:hypothetical protein